YDDKFKLNKIIQTKDQMYEGELEKRKERLQLFDKFVECVCNTGIDDQITIYTIGIKEYKYICFNRFSVRIFEKDYADYGIIKITDGSNFRDN
ncbi:MAG: hypothetical protein K2J78_05005, partial [Muribaculaceae bacterium]|nr:hypothetical protein [Muribaculaceae bacterium]